MRKRKKFLKDSEFLISKDIIFINRNNVLSKLGFCSLIILFFWWSNLNVLYAIYISIIFFFLLSFRIESKLSVSNKMFVKKYKFDYLKSLTLYIKNIEFISLNITIKGESNGVDGEGGIRYNVYLKDKYEAEFLFGFTYFREDVISLMEEFEKKNFNCVLIE